MNYSNSKVINFRKINNLPLIKYILSTFYKFRKIKNIQKYKTSEMSSGLIIEFMGPSGIGKTTLFNEIWRYHKKKWFSKNDIVLLKEKNDIDPFSIFDDFNSTLYEKLLWKKFFLTFQGDRLLKTKVSLYEFYRKQIEIDIFVSHYKLPKGLLSDDGICGNFLEEVIYILLKTKENDALLYEIKKFFSNRSIVYFHANPSIIIDHLKQRSIDKPNSNNDYYSFYGPDIDSFVQNMIDKFEILINLLEDMNIPIIKIDMKNESRVEQVQKVNSFINNQIRLNQNYHNRKI